MGFGKKRERICQCGAYNLQTSVVWFHTSITLDHLFSDTQWKSLFPVHEWLSEPVLGGMGGQGAWFMMLLSWFMPCVSTNIIYPVTYSVLSSLLWAQLVDFHIFRTISQEVREIWCSESGCNQFCSFSFLFQNSSRKDSSQAMTYSILFWFLSQIWYKSFFFGPWWQCGFVVLFCNNKHVTIGWDQQLMRFCSRLPSRVPY